MPSRLWGVFILGCDTSSIASGALLRVEQAAASGEPCAGPIEVLGRFRTEDTRSHAEVMAPGIRGLLDDAGIRGQDIAMILTGVGPGPFTGLRAGIMTARTLGWAWGVPVRGVVSLDAVAEGVAEDARASGLSEFMVATDARRREVYSATYRMTDPSAAADGTPGYVRSEGPSVGPAADLDPDLPTAGRGAELYPESLTPLDHHAKDEPLAELLVAAALRVGLDSTLASTSPLYLRGSDARVPADRKRASR